MEYKGPWLDTVSVCVSAVTTRMPQHLNPNLMTLVAHFAYAARTLSIRCGQTIPAQSGYSCWVFKCFLKHQLIFCVLERNFKLNIFRDFSCREEQSYYLTKGWRPLNVTDNMAIIHMTLKATHRSHNHVFFVYKASSSPCPVD